MLKLIDRVVSLLPKPLRDWYYEHEDLMLYLVFGALTTVVSFVAQGLAKAALGTDAVATNVATAFSWLCAVTFAFVTNKKYVFKSVTETSEALLAELGSFYAARIVSLVLELLIMNVFYVRLGLNYWVVKLCAQVFIVVANYVFSKLVVFKDRSSSEG